LTTASDDPPALDAAVPRGMTILLAATCGLIVANLYYAQPLAGPISAALGLSHAGAGLIVTMTQLGYGAGLLFIVPLGDLVENRRLILAVTALATLALLGAALAPSAGAFLLAALLIGIGSVAVQILVPYAAHLAPEAKRGQVVGNVMSGLMLGIMLSRPIASFIAQVSSWHAVFFASTAVMVVLMGVLLRALPPRRPTQRLGYGALLASMLHLARTMPVLRRRALYQFCLFGAFSLFWTTTPLLLAGPLYHLSQFGIALFALAGVAGAVSAPLAGRVADRGWIRPASGLAMLIVAAGFAITHIAAPGSTLALGLLVAGAIVVDFGVTANLVLGQRAIFSLGAEYRARLNGMFMAFFFVGGAVGSAAGGWAFAAGGWPLASALGIALPILALILWSIEWAGRRGA
jgi:predicted MFS family arabinose efflux permease